jgi:polysaccharide biosynthesis protein VpsJ
MTQLGQVSVMTELEARTILTGEREPAAPDQLREVYRALVATLEAADFRGPDPYDGLNSALFAATPLARLAIARLAWQQLIKRSPYGLRKIVRIAPTTNPVTLALAARTYARMGETAKGQQAITRLLAMRCDPTQWGAGAWGYPFPWQAKAFFVPLGVPNVIATAYALRTIAECETWIGGGADPIIAGAADFVATALARQINGRRYIGYVPNSATMVHNASLWGVYVLALAVRRGHAEYRDLADAAIDYTLAAQSPDGSWVYGEASHHQWTDGFHTGYVLEALELCGRLLDRADLRMPIARGLHHYLTEFPHGDGSVAYYSGGGGPLDVNNFAQMVTTLELLKPDWQHFADRVLVAAIRELWCPELAAFAYQRHGSRLDRTFYPRWTQIWMMHALSLRLAPAADG